MLSQHRLAANLFTLEIMTSDPKLTSAPDLKGGIAPGITLADVSYS